MKKNIQLYLMLLALPLLAISCQNRDFNIADAIVPPVNNLQSSLIGDSVKLTWNLPSGFDTLSVSVQTNNGVVALKNNATSYTFGVVEVNKAYGFTVKLKDTEGNISVGQTVRLTRGGAMPVKNVSGVQNDNNIVLSWGLPDSSITGITLKYGTKTINLGPTVTSYEIANASIGTYNFSLVTTNSRNQTSHSVFYDFKVGATLVAYLGDAPDSLSIADDDEIAGAKWLFSTYPKARYISFDMIKNGTVDLSQFRVIWWNYDVETGSALPAIANDATVLSKLTQYHKNGGNLLLNTYAIQYLWKMGRLTIPYFTGVDTGAGFNNPDAWGIGVNISKAHNQSSHPLYKGITMTTQADGRVTFPVIGAGWKENHNYVLVRIPETYGLANDNEQAYVKFTTDNNAEWLGQWDGIGDYWMCGIFELKPKDDFQGSSISIGIGGIEWNQNNTTNPYQSTVNALYKNAIDYLKTK